MKLTIDRESAIGIKDQIVSELQSRIETSILKAGQRLPSVRKMAATIQVSPMTVVKAYETLEAAGLVEKIHGKGTFVKKKKHTVTMEDQGDRIEGSEWQDTIEDYVQRSGYVQRTLMSRHQTGINLTLAALHHRFVPTRKILDKFQEWLVGRENELGQYPPVEGDPRLIKAVQSYMLDRGIEAPEDQIIITTGTQLALNLIAQTYIGPGDVVVVESPTFPGAIDVFKNRGAVIVDVPIVQGGVRTDLLLDICERYPVKLFFTMATFQNPTSYSYSHETSMELLDLAKEFNFLIVEDDTWGDLSYEKPERSLKDLDQDDRVIYVSGFSKVYGPSIRLSAITSGERIHSRLLSMKANLDSGAPLMNQLMLAPYLDSLEDKQHLIWLRHELKALRDAVHKHMKKHMPAYVKWDLPKGGLVFWLTLPHGFDVQLLYYRAITEENISFLVGHNCYVGAKGNNQLRLCYSYGEEVDVMVGVERLAKLIESVRNTMKSGVQNPIF